MFPSQDPKAIIAAQAAGKPPATEEEAKAQAMAKEAKMDICNNLRPSMSKSSDANFLQSTFSPPSWAHLPSS